MTATVELLAKLVAFDTTSSRSNLGLIDFVQPFLEGCGATVRRVTNPSGTKAAIHAVFGDPSKGGLAFSGHVDTVPVEGQRWSANPFSLREHDGRLHARGAVDMKGFVASFVAAAPDLAAMRLERPIHFLISYDEEVDASGARRLVEDMASAGWKPDLCIVGEPTGMAAIVAHKAKLVVTGRAAGLAGHSSQPALGVNAVHAAAEAIAWAAALARRHAECGPFEDGFDPPYSTVHVGTSWGGASLNIIPEAAGFAMEWRPIPGDDAMAELAAMRAHVAERIEPAMRAVYPSAGLALDVDCFYPGLSTDPQHPLVSLVTNATGLPGAGKASYATEAGVFHDAGIATVVCGPGHIAQAHRPDEWIARSELDACDRFIREVSRRYAAGQENKP